MKYIEFIYSVEKLKIDLFSAFNETKALFYWLQITFGLFI